MPTQLAVTRPSDFMEFPRACILQGIHQCFEEQVRRRPDHLALRTRGAALTYAQANGFANSIAARILSAVGTPLAQAAILQPHTPEVIWSTRWAPANRTTIGCTWWIIGFPSSASTWPGATPSPRTGRW